MSSAKRIWIKKFYLSRTSASFQQFRLPTLLSKTEKDLKRFIRIDKNDFDYLLNRLRKFIEKKHVVREPISARERLLITLRCVFLILKIVLIFYLNKILIYLFYYHILRHLATGDDYTSLSYLLGLLNKQFE